MKDVREKFRRLTQVFDPIYKPEEGGADSSYVPETHEDYRRQLDAALDLNDNVKLLVAGQPGCGKTTLLRHMARSLRKEGRIVAFVDLEAYTAVQDLDPVEMYIAALTELLTELDGRRDSISAKSLEECCSWLMQMLGSSEPISEPGHIANSLRRHLSNLRDNPSLRYHQRSLVSPGKASDPFEILCHVLSDLSACRPVIILDGLDKIPPERAQKTFLDDKKKPMTDAPGAAILTIPISVVYEPTFNVLSERYFNADSAVLPAVRLWEFNGQTRTRSDKGFSILRNIVARRVDPIDPNMMLPKTVEKAIEGSAGNIRELARLIQAGAVKAYARRKTCIDSEDIEAAIGDQRESFRRAYKPDFLPLLERVHKEYKMDDSTEIAKQLLYGLWVMEYRNGESWYSLPDPVEQLLERLQRNQR